MNNNVSWRGKCVLFFWPVVNTLHSEQASASTGLQFLGEASIKHKERACASAKCYLAAVTDSDMRQTDCSCLIVERPQSALTTSTCCTASDLASFPLIEKCQYLLMPVFFFRINHLKYVDFPARYEHILLMTLQPDLYNILQSEFFFFISYLKL